jgi:hypothetical protein
LYRAAPHHAAFAGAADIAASTTASIGTPTKVFMVVASSKQTQIERGLVDAGAKACM